MSLLSQIVKIADTVTKGLKFQGKVTHKAWISQDGRGNYTYAAAVPRNAIIDTTAKYRTVAVGQVIWTKAHITFLETVTPNGAAGRKEPIDPRDIITLPDGSTGKILEIPGGGIIDPSTNLPVMNEVFFV